MPGVPRALFQQADVSLSPRHGLDDTEEELERAMTSLSVEPPDRVIFFSRGFPAVSYIVDIPVAHWNLIETAVMTEFAERGFPSELVRRGWAAGGDAWLGEASVVAAVATVEAAVQNITCACCEWFAMFSAGSSVFAVVLSWRSVDPEDPVDVDPVDPVETRKYGIAFFDVGARRVKLQPLNPDSARCYPQLEGTLHEDYCDTQLRGKRGWAVDEVDFSSIVKLPEFVAACQQSTPHFRIASLNDSTPRFLIAFLNAATALLEDSSNALTGRAVARINRLNRGDEPGRTVLRIFESVSEIVPFCREYTLMEEDTLVGAFFEQWAGSRYARRVQQGVIADMCATAGVPFAAGTELLCDADLAECVTLRVPADPSQPLALPSAIGDQTLDPAQPAVASPPSPCVLLGSEGRIGHQEMVDFAQLAAPDPPPQWDEEGGEGEDYHQYPSPPPSPLRPHSSSRIDTPMPDAAEEAGNYHQSPPSPLSLSVPRSSSRIDTPMPDAIGASTPAPRFAGISTIDVPWIPRADWQHSDELWKRNAAFGAVVLAAVHSTNSEQAKWGYMALNEHGVRARDRSDEWERLPRKTTPEPVTEDEVHGSRQVRLSLLTSIRGIANIFATSVRTTAVDQFAAAVDEFEGTLLVLLRGLTAVQLRPVAVRLRLEPQRVLMFGSAERPVVAALVLDGMDAPDNPMLQTLTELAGGPLSGAALEESTISGHQQRLRLFATFSSVTTVVPFAAPSNALDLLVDASCTALTSWLDAQAARSVSKGTRAGDCNAVISYLKVVIANGSGAEATTAQSALAATQ